LSLSFVYLLYSTELWPKWYPFQLLIRQHSPNFQIQTLLAEVRVLPAFIFDVRFQEVEHTLGVEHTANSGMVEEVDGVPSIEQEEAVVALREVDIGREEEVDIGREEEVGIGQEVPSIFLERVVVVEPNTTTEEASIAIEVDTMELEHTKAEEVDTTSDDLTDYCMPPHHRSIQAILDARKQEEE
jgi:hypothetical protein